MAKITNDLKDALSLLNEVRFMTSSGIYVGPPFGELLRRCLEYPPLQVWTGAEDPSINGVPGSSVGDLYLRDNIGPDGGELWIRFGDDETDWERVTTAASLALPTNKIFVGSAGGVATGVSMGGEAGIVANGTVTLSNDAVIGKLLTGFSSGAGVVAATDSLLQGLQKIDGNEIVTRGVANAALPAASFTDAAVTGKLITGFASGMGTVTDTDTILEAFNKLDGNISEVTNVLYVDGNRAATYTETGSILLPFRTIQAAIDAVVSPSATNKYLIDIAPGIYYSDPIAINKVYLTFRSCGVQGARISGKITITNPSDPTPEQITFVGLRISGGLDCFASHIAINVIDCNVTGTAWVINPAVPTDDEYLQVWGGLWYANATLTNVYSYLMGGGYYSTFTVTNKEFNINNADINDPFTAILSGTLTGSAFGNRTGNSKFTLNAGVDLHMDADTEGGSVVTIAGGTLTRSTKAISILYDNSVSGLVSTDVQAALDEIYLWDRSGTVLTPRYAGDDLDLGTATLTVGDIIGGSSPFGLTSKETDRGSGVAFRFDTENALSEITYDEVATVDGTALGIITVADASAMTVGDRVKVYDDDTDHVWGYIVAITEIAGPAYELHIQDKIQDGSDVDLSSYTVGQNAKIESDYTKVFQISKAGIPLISHRVGTDLMWGDDSNLTEFYGQNGKKYMEIASDLTGGPWNYITSFNDLEIMCVPTGTTPGDGYSNGIYSAAYFAPDSYKAEVVGPSFEYTRILLQPSAQTAILLDAYLTPRTLVLDAISDGGAHAAGAIEVQADSGFLVGDRVQVYDDDTDPIVLYIWKIEEWDGDLLFLAVSPIGGPAPDLFPYTVVNNAKVELDTIKLFEVRNSSTGASLPLISVCNGLDLAGGSTSPLTEFYNNAGNKAFEIFVDDGGYTNLTAVDEIGLLAFPVGTETGQGWSNAVYGETWIGENYVWLGVKDSTNYSAMNLTQGQDLMWGDDAGLMEFLAYNGAKQMEIASDLTGQWNYITGLNDLELLCVPTGTLPGEGSTNGIYSAIYLAPSSIQIETPQLEIKNELQVDRRIEAPAMLVQCDTGKIDAWTGGGSWDLDDAAQIINVDSSSPTTINLTVGYSFRTGDVGGFNFEQYAFEIPIVEDFIKIRTDDYITISELGKTTVTGYAKALSGLTYWQVRTAPAGGGSVIDIGHFTPANAKIETVDRSEVEWRKIRVALVGNSTPVTIYPEAGDGFLDGLSAHVLNQPNQVIELVRVPIPGTGTSGSWFQTTIYPGDPIAQYDNITEVDSGTHDLTETDNILHVTYTATNVVSINLITSYDLAATVDGTSDGWITVADASTVQVGDFVTIDDDNSGPVTGYVVEIDSGEIHVQSATHGGTNVSLSTYTVAQNAHIWNDPITRKGRTIIIKDAGGNANTNPITISTAGAETIDGQNDYTINTDYGKVTLYFDGSDWFVI